MSLPLLISLFLAALVGVFPATGPITTSALPAPAAVTYAVEHQAQADASPADHGTAPVTAPHPGAVGTEPTPGGHPAARVLTTLDVHAAAAPRAPPLLLV